MSGIILGESDHSDSDEWERLGNYFEIIRKLLDRIERKMPQTLQFELRQITMSAITFQEIMKINHKIKEFKEIFKERIIDIKIRNY